jgi:hypothetical protein
MLNNSSRNKPIILKKKNKTIDIDHIKSILLMKRFEEIRRKRREKEKEEKELQKKKNNNSQWHNLRSKDEVLGYQFRRNPFDEQKKNKFDIKKHQKAIELLNRNMEKNKMNNALKEVTLHFTNIKSKLNINNGEDEFTLIKKKIKESQKKNISNKKNKKGKLYLNKNFNTEFQIKNYTIDTRRQRHYSVIPPKHGKNYYMLKRLSNSYRKFNTDYSNNIMKKRRPLSLNHKLNIRNEPIYTGDIRDFVDEYNRIKKSINSERRKLKRRHLISYENIKEIMDVKCDMEIFSLKQKYLNLKFKKPEKVKSNKPKIDVFIDKMVSECQRIDYDLY